MTTTDPLQHLDFDPDLYCDARTGTNHPNAATILVLRTCPAGCPPHRLLLCTPDAIRFRASGTKRCAQCGHAANANQWIAAQLPIPTPNDDNPGVTP